ncbi:MAG: hypothetical protein ACLQO1_25070 [Steroidobacteraceae bacterium]
MDTAPVETLVRVAMAATHRLPLALRRPHQVMRMRRQQQLVEMEGPLVPREPPAMVRQAELVEPAPPHQTPQRPARIMPPRRVPQLAGVAAQRLGAVSLRVTVGPF